MKIAIVGAGIGGPSLALALHQRGVPSDVYEAVPETNRWRPLQDSGCHCGLDPQSMPRERLATNG
jgi:2-polyprenyl-6-methoxyphenol hydroxylase-like FAD-dependent oxidoreductase